MRRMRMLWIATLAIGLLVGQIAPAALGQVAGVGDVIVRPTLQLTSPALQQLRLQRRLEVPTDLVLRGVPAVRFSYGDFILLTEPQLESHPDSAGDPGIQATPPDEHHAGKTVADLSWSRFYNTLHLQTSVKNQGSRGTCHVQAASGLAEAMYNRRALNAGQGEKLIDLSEQWLQYMVKKNADFSVETGDGGNTQVDLETIRDQGHVPEVYWKYDARHWSNMAEYASLAGDTPGKSPWPWRLVAQTTTGQPPPAVTVAISRRGANPNGLENFKIKNITSGGTGTTGVNFITNKINQGIPVAIAVPWPRGVMFADGCIIFVPDEALNKTRAELWDDVYPDDHPTGGLRGKSKWFRGGHAIIIVGYGKPGTEAEGLYAFKNSWSRWWGNDGYGYFSKTWLTQFMQWCATCESNSS